MRTVLLLILTLGFPMSALAYVGPGMGAGAVGVIVGLVASVGLALIALFWYPIKRAYRRWFPDEQADEEVAVEADEVEQGL